MKKYLLGLFAVVLAVAFSAFTSSSKSTNMAQEYWYLYNPSTFQIDLLNNQNVLRDKVNGVDGAIDLTGCDGASTRPVCAIAYPTQVTGTFPQTAPSGSDDQIFVH